MALHLGLLLLTSTSTSALPTVVELLNSVGLEYVAPDTGPVDLLNSVGLEYVAPDTGPLAHPGGFIYTRVATQKNPK